eukprot:CAMPEP_0170738370 /NCGR_PEP_ID=MMETSP0437-20130122/4611_1 /TAXON_ID=0 /ORGANISM="Sexangularia sp." /LENGTH=834 /DNA_ID=CAMNT_0011076793 /DNA_START=38 /DNA_END=2542 /DNA_ORIENTATION=-
MSLVYLFVLLATLLEGTWSTSVQDAITNPSSCSTLIVEGLAHQLLDETICRDALKLNRFSEYCPEYMIHMDPAAAAFPYMQYDAVQDFKKVCDARQSDSGASMYITSALRTLPQQLVLYEWKQTNHRCASSCCAVASPGNSRHETGQMIDLKVPNSAWDAAFTSNNFAVDENRVHHVHNGADNGFETESVKAFQELYNANLPPGGTPITVDGKYGAQTRSALLSAPVEGFPKRACQQEKTQPVINPHRGTRCLTGTSVPVRRTFADCSAAGEASTPALSPGDRVTIIDPRPQCACSDTVNCWIRVTQGDSLAGDAFFVPYESVLTVCTDNTPQPTPPPVVPGPSNDDDDTPPIPNVLPDPEIATCGNGQRDAGEECEAAETTTSGAVVRMGTGCQSGTCQCVEGYAPMATGPHCQKSCGNSVFEDGEECDPTGSPDPNNEGCDFNTCQCRTGFKPFVPPEHNCEVDRTYIDQNLPQCGNGLLDANEKCDPKDGLGCNAACECKQGWEQTAPPSVNCQAKEPASMTCGNAHAEGSEVCDSGQGCDRSTCQCQPGWRKRNPVALNCEPMPCAEWDQATYNELRSASGSAAAVHNRCCPISTGSSTYQECTQEQLDALSTLNSPFGNGKTLCASVEYTVQLLSTPCTGNVVYSLSAIDDRVVTEGTEAERACEGSWVKVKPSKGGTSGWVTTEEMKECGGTDGDSTTGPAHSESDFPGWAIAAIVGGVVCCYAVMCALIVCCGLGYKMSNDDKEKGAGAYTGMNVLDPGQPESPSYNMNSVASGPGTDGAYGGTVQMQAGYPNQANGGGFDRGSAGLDSRASGSQYYAANDHTMLAR